MNPHDHPKQPLIDKLQASENWNAQLHRAQKNHWYKNSRLGLQKQSLIVGRRFVQQVLPTLSIHDDLDAHLPKEEFLVSGQHIAPELMRNAQTQESFVTSIFLSLL